MATYYISTAGNDSNTGTSASPWLTISKGNTAAASGDTIYIAAGTYTFSTITLAKQITWIGAVPTISGLPTTILDGAAAHVCWSLGVTGNQVLSISNIMFQNVVQTSNQAVFASQNFVNTINFTNCVFTNMGVRSSGGGSGFGVICGAQSLPNTINLYGCLFYNIYTTGATAACVFDADTVIWNLYNVTIYHDAAGAAALAAIFRRNSTPYTINMKNCIFYSTTSLAFGGYITATVQYSCNYQISSVPAGTANITTDPLFVDTATARFDLRPTSPCLLTGTLV